MASHSIARGVAPRILVPYMLSYEGGVRNVLGDGLPYLRRVSGVDVEYAELCRNVQDMDNMEAVGVPVNRSFGLSESGIISQETGFRRRLDFLKAVPRLSKLLFRMRRFIRPYDVVYVHGYRELLFSKLAVLLGGRGYRTPLVWHCHGLDNAQLPPLLVPLANRCYRVIAISQDVGRRLVDVGVDPRIIQVVCNAVDVLRIWSEANRPVGSTPRRDRGDTIILLPSSSIRPAKGLHIAVRALGELPPTCHLWITGDGDDPAGEKYMQSLLSVIERAGLRGRVHFIGRRNDIYGLMVASDIVVVPSCIREGFGLVAAEAMALGKPVVVSNRGGLPEVLGSEENGWIFEPDIPGTLSACIREIIADTTEATRRGRNGVIRVEQAFGYERWAAEVSCILLDAAAAPL